MNLTNKTILILSQQDWGDMFISKHHYANELAKNGNRVYFVNGPDQRNILKPGQVVIEPTKVHDLFLIRHRLHFPYIIRFKAVSLYYRLVKRHINKIVKQVGRPIDVVWSFDLSDTIPLRFFPADCLKIFMPVDESTHVNAINAARGADIILSVTGEIISRYKQYPVPRHFINHGVADIFINRQVNETVSKPVHIGLSGNFLRPDIDYNTLTQIVIANSEVIFDFWGSCRNDGANLASSADVNSLAHINALAQLPNVVFHGQLPPAQLAEQLKTADGFLICYDIDKDQSKGTNYHKVLEYLGTGKVVVANNITTYQQKSELVIMPEERNNKTLPALFKEVTDNIARYNTAERQAVRIAFAQQHTYSAQLKKIGALIANIHSVDNA